MFMVTESSSPVGQGITFPFSSFHTFSIAYSIVSAILLVMVVLLSS